MGSGLQILADKPGDGAEIQRQGIYRLRLKLWLNRGEPIRWPAPWGPVDSARLEDDGETLVSDLRIDRESLFAGLFKGVQGMRVGGTRRLRIAPHLAYGEAGLPGIVPPKAVLVAEIQVLAEVPWGGLRAADSPA